jgi:hypothetical protein
MSRMIADEEISYSIKDLKPLKWIIRSEYKKIKIFKF